MVVVQRYVVTHTMVAKSQRKIFKIRHECSLFANQQHKLIQLDLLGSLVTFDRAFGSCCNGFPLLANEFLALRKIEGKEIFLDRRF